MSAATVFHSSRTTAGNGVSELPSPTVERGLETPLPKRAQGTRVPPCVSTLPALDDPSAAISCDPRGQGDGETTRPVRDTCAAIHLSVQWGSSRVKAVAMGCVFNVHALFIQCAIGVIPCATDPFGRAKLNADYVARHIRAFRLSPEQQFEIATKVPVTAAKHMANFSLSSELKFELARLSPGSAIANLRAFSLSPEQQFEVAKLARWTAEKFMNHLSLSPEQQFEIAKLRPDGAAKFISHFTLSPERQFEIAKRAPAEAAQNIRAFNLCSEREFEIAKRASTAAAANIGAFKLSPEQQFEIAKTAPQQAIENMIAFKLSPEQQFAIAKLAPAVAVRHREGLDLSQAQLCDCVRVLANSHAKIGFAEWVSAFPIERLPVRLLESLVEVMRTAAVSGDENDIKWANQHELYASLFHLRAPDMVLPMSRFVNQCCVDPATRQRFVDLPQGSWRRAAKFMPLVALVFARLQADGAEISTALVALQKQHRVYKDGAKARRLLQMLVEVCRPQDLSPEQKSRMIAKLADYQAIQSSQLVAHLGALTALAADDKPAVDVAQQVISQTFTNSLSSDDLAQLAATFERCRQPVAIWELLASAKKTADPRVIQAFTTYFIGVLRGTYFDNRYNLQKNRHLKTIHKRRPHVLTLWRRDMSHPLDVRWLESETQFDPRAWLSTKIITDGHLGRWLTPSLRRFLQPQAPVPRSHPALIGDDVGLAEQLTELCIALAQSPTLSAVADALRCLQAFFKMNVIECEFRHDVESSLQWTCKRINSHNMRVVETDDPYHLLLCGNEAGGSCQRTAGSPERNKGLLGYLLHGQTRLLAVVDIQNQNRVVARCLCRLLLAHNNEPVVFVDRLYGDARYEPALMHMAQLKAASLRLSLMTAAESSAPGVTLKSLGGPAPFEYADSGGGLCANGVFTVRGARRVNVDTGDHRGPVEG